MAFSPRQVTDLYLLQDYKYDFYDAFSLIPAQRPPMNTSTITTTKGNSSQMALSKALAPEIIWFTPSEEYLEDPSKMLSLIHQSSVTQGMLGSYYGVDIDNEDTGVWVLAWKTLGHHQRFMSDASYVDFMLPVMDSMVGTGEITQVLLSDIQELRKALTAPLTAFVYITMRPLHDRAYELVPLVEQFRKELKTIPTCLGSSWGPSIERKNIEVGVVGWRSMTDRDNAVRGRLAPLIRRVRELSKIEIRYVRLSCYSVVDFS